MQAMQTAQAEPLAAVLYGVGAIALLALIAAALYRHKVSGAAPPSAARLVCAVSLVGLLYGADFCTSTASDFNFSGRYWVFFPLGTFFVAVMGLEAKAGRRVLEVLAFALALQCAYAVFAYFQGINQFHTPYFGSRTCGTFDNPNSLYPLGLFAVELGVGLARAVEDRFSRCLFGGGALLGGGGADADLHPGGVAGAGGDAPLSGLQRSAVPLLSAPSDEVGVPAGGGGGGGAAAGDGAGAHARAHRWQSR
jgi:hypothetical protein